MVHFLVFMSGFLVDLFYTVWVRSLGVGRPFTAAGASSAIGATSMVGVLGVTKDWQTLPAYVLGLYLGTLVGYWLTHRK